MGVRSVRGTDPGGQGFAEVDVGGVDEAGGDAAGAPDEDAEDEGAGHHGELGREGGGRVTLEEGEVDRCPLGGEGGADAGQEVEEIDLDAGLEGVDEVALGQGGGDAEAGEAEEEGAAGQDEGNL